MAQLRASMSVQREHLVTPLRSTVVMVDDVFTQGRTFKAMQSILRDFPEVHRIAGVFLARTVWPPDLDFDVLDN